MKNPRWRSHRGFFTRIFLEFWVNIMWSAERSSAYCHYSSFFGRHHHSILTPSDDIEYQKNTDKYPSLLLVLWRQKTWNNGYYENPSRLSPSLTSMRFVLALTYRWRPWWRRSLCSPVNRGLVRRPRPERRGSCVRTTPASRSTGNSICMFQYMRLLAKSLARREFCRYI